MSGSIVLFPLNDYSNGSRTVGPHVIPGQVSTITFAVARKTSADPTIFPDPASTIFVLIEGSYDGGVTWSALASAPTNGGIVPGHHGGELAESSWSGEFLGPRDAEARMTVTVAGGPVRTQGTLRWT